MRGLVDLPTTATDKPIDADIPCTSCGYNLRGLNTNGNCPECGAGAIGSAQRFWLNQRLPGLAGADPRWLAEMRWGTALVLLGFAIMLFVAGSTDRRWAPFHLSMRQLLYIACTGWTLAYWGAWKLTARWRDPLRPDQKPGFRWLGALPVLAVLTPGWMFLDYAVRRKFGWEPEIISTFMALVGLLACAACTGVCMLRLATCAAKNLANRLRYVLSGLGIVQLTAYAIIVFVAPRLNGFRSLYTLVNLPLPTGSPDFVAWAPQLMRENPFRNKEWAIAFVLTITELASLVMMMWMLVVLTYASHNRRRRLKWEAAHGSTQASSRP